MRNLDYLDYRIAIMTGTSGGVTGGDIIPDGMIGVIRDIQYSEVTQTGQTIRLRMQPSGSDIDIKRLAANQNFPSGPRPITTASVRFASNAFWRMRPGGRSNFVMT